MRTIITKTLTAIAWALFWPHAILYTLSPYKKEIMEDTIRNMSFRKANINGISAVLYVLLLDKYYRTLFYYRLGKPSILFSWLWTGDKSFSISSLRIRGGYFVYTHPQLTSMHNI